MGDKRVRIGKDFLSRCGAAMFEEGVCTEDGVEICSEKSGDQTEKKCREAHGSCDGADSDFRSQDDGGLTRDRRARPVNQLHAAV